MSFVKKLTAVFLLIAACGYAAPARACPLCKEAAESAIDTTATDQEYVEDPAAEAKAYNRSIYMMIGVPYTFFAIGGFYCYRHLKGRGQAGDEQNQPIAD